jgi:molybdopterin-guanine dinucleotide biosynthesis protein A
VNSWPKPVGVILAGGLARRMGGDDKALRLLGGRPLLEHVLARLRPQVDGIVLNANGDPARFAHWQLPVVPDAAGGPHGPLAGVLAGMVWTQRNRPAIADIMTVPTDSPFIPHDLVLKLLQERARRGGVIALAGSGGRPHPVIGLWPVRLAPLLAEALARGERRVGAWALAQGAVSVNWPTTGFDPFLNLNRPEELVAAELMLRSQPQS